MKLTGENVEHELVEDHKKLVKNSTIQTKGSRQGKLTNKINKYKMDEREETKNKHLNLMSPYYFSQKKWNLKVSTENSTFVIFE